MILVFTLIYVLGFGAMTVAPVFVVIVLFRFVQTFWLSGIADPAYQAIFNVVPPARRDQVRTFMGGVPDQAGTFIAGLVLLIGEQAFRPQELALIGFLASAACAYVIWRASRAYNQALVDALRAGRPQVFFSEEEPFGGFRQDSAARATLIAGTRDDDLVIRRVSTEILGQVHIPRSRGSIGQCAAELRRRGAHPCAAGAGTRAGRRRGRGRCWGCSLTLKMRCAWRPCALCGRWTCRRTASCPPWSVC